jgi:hypothetical protein
VGEKSKPDYSVKALFAQSERFYYIVTKNLAALIKASFYLSLSVLPAKSNNIKLSRGEICVANFRPPCDIYDRQ